MAWYKYDTNPMKWLVHLVSRILLNLVEVSFLPGDCLYGLKWDPRYMWCDIHHRSTLLGLLDDHVFSLYISNIPLETSSFNKTFIPCHLSWITFKSLDENSTGINLLTWPVMSPDLNAIEHIFGAIERDIWASDSPFSNVYELLEIVQRLWINMPY